MPVSRSSASKNIEILEKYSDEKETTGLKLGESLASMEAQHIRILDVGTGNGLLLEMALDSVGSNKTFEVTIIEPDSHNLKLATKRLNLLDSVVSIGANQTTFENTDVAVGYDVIICSHVFYYFPVAKRQEYLERMVGMLTGGGALLVVLRQQDDVYDFKMTVNPPTGLPALTLNELLEAAHEAIVVNKVINAESDLVFPSTDFTEDFHQLISFHLGIEWTDIPNEMRDKAVKYIEKKNHRFRQIDGIALINAQA